nr:hypothetical protein CFP56_04093 [Quercus suber]
MDARMALCLARSANVDVDDLMIMFKMDAGSIHGIDAAACSNESLVGVMTGVSPVGHGARGYRVQSESTEAASAEEAKIGAGLVACRTLNKWYIRSSNECPTAPALSDMGKTDRLLQRAGRYSREKVWLHEPALPAPPPANRLGSGRGCVSRVGNAARSKYSHLMASKERFVRRHFCDGHDELIARPARGMCEGLVDLADRHASQLEEINGM